MFLILFKNKDIAAQNDESLNEASTINTSFEEISEGHNQVIEVKNTPKKNQVGQRNQPINYIAFLSILANSLIALLIYRNHRERIAILSDKKFVQPEEIQTLMQSFRDSVNNCNRSLSEIRQHNESLLRAFIVQSEKVLNELQGDLISYGEDVKDIKETYKLLRNDIKEKDEEIKRYKEGYDISLIKRSVEGYLLLNNRISNYIENEKTGPESLKNLHKIIEDAILRSGVSVIEVFEGDDYFDDKYNGKIDASKELLTNEPENDSKIVSVDRLGYEILGNELTTIISKAKVTIYKYNQKEEL